MIPRPARAARPRDAPLKDDPPIGSHQWRAGSRKHHQHPSLGPGHHPRRQMSRQPPPRHCRHPRNHSTRPALTLPRAPGTRRRPRACDACGGADAEARLPLRHRAPVHQKRRCDCVAGAAVVLARWAQHLPKPLAISGRHLLLDDAAVAVVCACRCLRHQRSPANRPRSDAVFASSCPPAVGAN
eukprot:scaffold7906_cov118-Isochrysis_galbana.AAC.5